MSLALAATAAATDSMTFAQHLVLWLHVGFAVFTLGPLTLAISSTPRYIRRGEVTVVRYLSRITLIFGIGSLGVLLVGVVLSQMLSEAAKPYLIVSETLFLVTIALLLLIVRDQRLALRALTAGAGPAGTVAVPAGAARAEHGDDGEIPPGSGDERLPGEGEQDSPVPGADPVPPQAANVERSRIAMLGGLTALIYLVILVLMIFNN